MRDLGRWTALVAGTLATFAGATVLYRLVLQVAVLGNCGPRWGVPCGGDRFALTAGLLALVFGGILLGWAASLAGRTGPAAGVAAVALVYGIASGSGGAVTGVFATGGGIGWKLTLTAVAVLPLLVLWAGVAATKEKGFRRTFWYLDVAALRHDRPTYRPDKDDRTFRVVPTPEEAGTVRAFWALYVALMLTGVAGGVLYVLAVS